MWSCIYQCKDTNFKANHNGAKNTYLWAEVVFTNAKILILKLITTKTIGQKRNTSCIYQCKDTNFKANHNRKDTLTIWVISCIYQCKDTNFKANHNQTTICTKRQLLYLPMQRY